MSQRGSAVLQADVAVGLVWFLLIGGVVHTVELATQRGDAAILAGQTLVVPGIVWKALGWLSPS